MEYQVGWLTEKLRDIHCKSHLVQMVELSQAPLMEGQVGIFLSSLRGIHWESHLMHMVNLR